MEESGVLGENHALMTFSKGTNNFLTLGYDRMGYKPRP